MASVNNDFSGLSDMPEPLASFSDLSLPLVAKILHFASRNPRDLVRCERVCKAFRDVLAIDESWRDCHSTVRNGQGFETTHREFALINCILDEIEKHRKNTDNLILTTLGVAGFRTMLEQFVRSDVNTDKKFVVRGDTFGLLAEIVQSFVVSKLSKSNDTAVHAAWKHKTSEYPWVTKPDLDFVRFITEFPVAELRPHDSNAPRSRPFPLKEFDLVRELVPEETRKKIVRKLAYRARVVRLSDEAFSSVWDDIVSLLYLFLYTSIEIIMDLESFDGVPDDEEVDMFRQVPPERVLEDGRTEYTLIPGFVHDEAMLFGLPHVHGDTWVAADGDRVEEEKAEELLRYRVNNRPAEESMNVEDSEFDEIDESEDVSVCGEDERLVESSDNNDEDSMDESSDSDDSHVE